MVSFSIARQTASWLVDRSADFVPHEPSTSKIEVFSIGNVR
jgi:hypothetical protein